MKVSEVNLSYTNRVYLSDSPKITQSSDAYEVFIENWNASELELRESFKIMLLNRANKVKGIFTVSEGGVSGTVVDAKLVFATALKALSCSLILAHNHPSGNIYPSEADKKITKKLKEAGKTLDIEVLDHLIITKETYYSFADEFGM